MRAHSFPDFGLGGRGGGGVEQHAKMFKAGFNHKHVGLFLVQTSALPSSMEAVNQVLLLLKHPYKVGQETAADYLSWGSVERKYDFFAQCN